MSGFQTDLPTLQATAAQTKAALDPIAGHTRSLKSAIDLLNGWQGEAKNAFLNMMGIKLPELERLNASLLKMSDNLNLAGQGVTSGESDAVKALTNAAGTSLSGAPLNDPR